MIYFKYIFKLFLKIETSLAINLKNILNYSIKFIFILIFFAKNIEIFI